MRVAPEAFETEEGGERPLTHRDTALSQRSYGPSCLSHAPHVVLTIDRIGVGPRGTGRRWRKNLEALNGSQQIRLTATMFRGTVRRTHDR